MTYEQTLQFIHSLDRFGSRLGLENITDLLDRLGNPQNACRYIHVAGTNGKGSTAMYCSAVLREAGYTVGTYLSPYVVDFRERIQLGGNYIEKQELIDAVAQIVPHYEAMREAGNQLTEFELITAAAFLYFQKKQCDVVCLEVGLGGRFDATNVIDKPLVSVITSISLDHTQILGDTTAQIAFEKCGILKPGCPAVSYPLQDEDALATIMEQCALKGCTLHLPNPSAVTVLDDSLMGLTFTYDGLTLSPKLLGRHQIYNAVTAVEALKTLRAQGFTIDNATVERGICNTVFPARMEMLSQNPLVFLDGAHNPSGIASLCDSLQKLPQKPLLIMGMLADKDYEASLAQVAPLAAQLFAVTPDNPRKLLAADLAKVAARHTAATPFDNYTDAVRAALSAVRAGQAIVACGSLYLASSLREVFKEELPHV